MRILKQVCFSSLALILVTSLMVSLSPAPAAADNSGSTSVILQAGEYSMGKDNMGRDTISMAGFPNATSPGDPALPCRVYQIALPPDVDWPTVKLNFSSLGAIILEGTYNIAPAPPRVALADGQIVDWGTGKDIVDGRNIKVYGVDLYYPLSQVKLLPHSQMRKWQIAKVEFFPFLYNPVTEKLSLLQDVTIQLSYNRLSYDRPAAQSAAGLLNDTAMDDVAAQTLYNYDQAREIYDTGKGMQASGTSSTYDYVIITTNAAQSGGCTKLAPFIAHKQSRGHSVLVVTEDTWGAVTGQAPNGNAQKIRQWLKDNYIAMGIKYVLLIGCPDPANIWGMVDVTMLTCWPRRGAGDGWEVAPTDYYYADLTGNWDIDGDGYYGEVDDCIEGGVDLAPEVYVGRMSAYGDTYIKVDDVLQKTINYETAPANSIAWRKSALLAMSFTYAGPYGDHADFGEWINTNILVPNSYSAYRMYMQGSTCSDADSIYDSQQELIGGDTVRDRWRDNAYGVVCWLSHGDVTEARVGYGGCEVTGLSGRLLYSEDRWVLDDTHPAFTFQGACKNGYPERADNLQNSLLKVGAIGTVGSTRTCWAGGTEAIGKQYLANLVGSGYAAGKALYNAKSVTGASLMDLFDFNLYGDPSTGLSSSAAPVIALPAVTTNAASSVEEYSACFNGTVTDDGGAPCEWRFSWGTAQGGPYNSHFGWQTPAKSTGDSFFLCSDLLSKGQKYYCIAQATNDGGVTIADGNEVAFTTKPDAPTVMTANVINSNGIDLAWTKGTGAQKTMIRSRTDGISPSSPSDGVEVYFNTGSSFAHTGLLPNTTYNYTAWSWVEGSDVWSDDHVYASASTGPVIGTFGYMGIGTDNPQRPLHLLGNACLFERAQDSAGFIIKRTSANRWVFGVDEDPQSQFVIKSYPEGSPATVRMSIDLLGNVVIPGILSKGSGTFRIDHPLDPANRYLSHSFVESPDMLNVYSGNAVMDGEGKAVIQLPSYFETLNRDFSYQLEGVGEYAPLYIEREIKDNNFTIVGGRPGMKVSWQVVGIRHDPYANAHPVIIEQEKPVGEGR